MSRPPGRATHRQHHPDLRGMTGRNAHLGGRSVATREVTSIFVRRRRTKAPATWRTAQDRGRRDCRWFRRSAGGGLALDSREYLGPVRSAGAWRRRELAVSEAGDWQLGAASLRRRLGWLGSERAARATLVRRWARSPRRRTSMAAPLELGRCSDSVRTRVESASSAAWPRSTWNAAGVFQDVGSRTLWARAQASTWPGVGRLGHVHARRTSGEASASGPP
jgi:hypothetical protein